MKVFGAKKEYEKMSRNKKTGIRILDNAYSKIANTYKEYVDNKMNSSSYARSKAYHQNLARKISEQGAFYNNRQIGGDYGKNKIFEMKQNMYGMSGIESLETDNTRFNLMTEYFIGEMTSTLVTRWMDVDSWKTLIRRFKEITGIDISDLSNDEIRDILEEAIERIYK